jgi:hypothetical protein
MNLSFSLILLMIAYVKSIETPNLYKYIDDLINETLNKTKSKLSQSCFDTLSNAYNNKFNLFTIKLLRDSAKNKNDLGAYEDCYLTKYNGLNETSTKEIEDQLLYVIISIHRKENWYQPSDIRYETGNYIFGGCIAKGCSTDEYLQLFYTLNNITQIFGDLPLNDISIYEYSKEDSEPLLISLSLIPIYIIFILLLLSCFPVIPVFCFRNCFLLNKKPTQINNGKEDVSKMLKTMSLEFSNHKIEDPEPDFNMTDIRKRFDSEGEDDLSSSMTPSSSSGGENIREIIAKKIEQLRETKVNERKKSIPEKKYNMQRLNKFKECFNIIENGDELLNRKGAESGLSIVKGLRGITIILLVIGFTFKYLYSSPVKIFASTTFKSLITSSSFSFILFGWRFGPRLVFSISGYILIYKYLSYLDNELVKIEGKCQETTTNNNIFSGSEMLIPPLTTTADITKLHSLKNLTEERNIFLNMVDLKQNTNESKEESQYRKFRIFTANSNISPKLSLSYAEYCNKLPYSAFYKFFLSQSYKYLYFILVTMIFKYSLYYLVFILYHPGPIWVYLKQVIIDSYTWKYILSSLLLISTYHPSLSSPNDLYLMAACEINYFIYGTLLIFFTYKKTYRLDIIITILLFIFTFGKFFLFVFLIQQKLLFPALSFHPQDLYYIFKNPFYNCSTFFIGAFFGMMNYCIQKSISLDNLHEENKLFLSWPCKILQFYRNRSASCIILMSILEGLLFLTLTLGFLIIYQFGFSQNDPYMNEFYHNFWVNVYFVFDVDFAVLLVWLCVFPLTIIGTNSFISFLTHDFWNFLTNPYWSMLMLQNLFILFFFYQSESRIKLELFNLIFFSLLILVILTFLCSFFYLIYEIPMKKLNRFILYPDPKDEEDNLIRSKKSL